MKLFLAVYLFAYWLCRPFGLFVSSLVERWKEVRAAWAVRHVPHDSRCWCNRCRAHRRRFLLRQVREDSEVSR